MYRLSLLLLLILNSNIVFGQNYFQKVFGDSTLQEKGILVHQTSDGTIYFIGNTAQQNNSNSAIGFIKLGANGEIIGEQDITTNGSLFANGMLYEGNRFLIVGERHTVGNIDGFALSIDTTGQVLQFEFYGLPNKTEVFKSVIKNQNGNYVITGFTTAQNNVGNDVYLTGLTPNLIQVWESIEGSGRNDVGHKAIQLPNGNIFVVCDQQQVAGNYNVYGQFYTSDGRFISEVTIADIYNGGSKSVILDNNDDIVIIGEMSTPTSSNFDMYMVKLDLNGQLIWKKYLTNTMNGDAGFGIIQPNNETYLVTGYGVGSVSQTQDIALISTDTTGNVIERKFYGGAGVEIGYTVFPSINGGYLIAGFDNIGSDVQYMLIYDNIDLSVSTSEIQLNNKKFMIFPNPVTFNQFNFNQQINKAFIKIIDTKGQVIEYGIITESDTYHVKNYLPSGNYFVNLQFDDFQKTIKISIKN